MDELTPSNLPNLVLDSLGEGVYICDLDRRILYWNKAAERITGWSASEVVGHRCHDNILCHVDKDGHRLCGKEFCPLHRSMVTGSASVAPTIIFPKCRDGHRFAAQTWVAPLRDAEGNVIGGIESFRDVSATMADLQRAKQIQSLSLELDVPADDRIRVNAFYTPQDVVGGDYFAVRPIDDGRLGFFLADAMGHGIAAALHTMHISALWDRLFHLLPKPAAFAASMNQELIKVVKDESFATAVCGILDIDNRQARFAAAGGPPLVILRSDGSHQEYKSPGFPFGVSQDPQYEEMELQFDAGDCLLLVSDGAIDIRDAGGKTLGITGLARILRQFGYPKTPVRKDGLDEELLIFSNALRLEDDMTMIGFVFPA
jgi:phosphoserine phosphatase RsbU/P